MDLDWEKLFKRYVWHDERTPYLTRVANLTRIQAQYEIFGYALFMGVLSAMLSIVTLRPACRTVGGTWPVYAFSVGLHGGKFSASRASLGGRVCAPRARGLA